VTENYLKLFESRIFNDTGETMPNFVITLQHQKNRPTGAPDVFHFRRYRPSGMGNHSRTGSSLNLEYIRQLTDSGK
jgi:hypothetical protein